MPPARLLLCAAAVVPGTAFGDITRAARQRIVRATVRVVSPRTSGPAQRCSGIMVTESGYGITSFHCVGKNDVESPGDQNTLLGEFYNENRALTVDVYESASSVRHETYAAHVVRADVPLDLALFRVENAPAGFRFNVVELGAGEDPPEIGDTIYTFGFPLASSTTHISSAVLSAVELTADQQVAWYRTDLGFNDGNSGGPVVDVSGRVIGVVSDVYMREFEVGGLYARSREPPMGFARPIGPEIVTWVTEAAAGTLEPTSLEVRNWPLLEPGASVADSSIGEVTVLAGDEVRFIRLSRLVDGDITVDCPDPTVLSRVTLQLFNLAGFEIRGFDPLSHHLDVLRSDPDGSFVVVTVRGATAARADYRLTYSVHQVASGSVQSR